MMDLNLVLLFVPIMISLIHQTDLVTQCVCNSYSSQNNSMMAPKDKTHTRVKAVRKIHTPVLPILFRVTEFPSIFLHSLGESIHSGQVAKTE